MTQSWDWKKNLTYTQVPKHLTGAVQGYSGVMHTNNGAFFAGRGTQTDLWQFGGTTRGFNTSFRNFKNAPDTNYSIWKYDDSVKLWSAIDTSSSQITVPSYGSSAEAPSLGLAFYLGGQVNAGTANSTQYLGNNTLQLGGMVVLNTDDGQIANLTVDDTVDGNRRGAGMIYVDTYGPSGVLALIGGHDLDGLVPMDQIGIFDVDSLDMTNALVSGPKKNTWYMQNATGDIPSPRRDFCLVSAPSQDNSSSNIYMYGGRANGNYFDDIYVLSLPSFTWIKVYSGTDARWSVTCHRVGARQMVTIAGGGKSDNITADCDWETSGVAILDLSTITWGSFYDAYAQPYLVPSSVTAKIGGNGTGGATKIQPDGGFENSNLAQVFLVQNATAITNVTTANGTTSAGNGPDGNGKQPGNSQSESGHLPQGAIAGIVVGTLALLLTVAAIVYLAIHNRRTSDNIAISLSSSTSTDSGDSKEKAQAELPGQERVEMGSEPKSVELGGQPMMYELSHQDEKHMGKATSLGLAELA